MDTTAKALEVPNHTASVPSDLPLTPRTVTAADRAEFQRRVKEELVKRTMSQRDFERRVWGWFGQLSKLFSGESNLTRKLLDEIAKGLSMGPLKLVDGTAFEDLLNEPPTTVDSQRITELESARDNLSDSIPTSRVSEDQSLSRSELEAITQAFRIAVAHAMMSANEVLRHPYIEGEVRTSAHKITDIPLDLDRTEAIDHATSKAVRASLNVAFQDPTHPLSRGFALFDEERGLVDDFLVHPEPQLFIFVDSCDDTRLAKRGLGGSSLIAAYHRSNGWISAVIGDFVRNNLYWRCAGDRSFAMRLERRSDSDRTLERRPLVFMDPMGWTISTTTANRLWRFVNGFTGWCNIPPPTVMTATRAFALAQTPSHPDQAKRWTVRGKGKNEDQQSANFRERPTCKVFIPVKWERPFLETESGMNSASTIIGASKFVSWHRDRSVVPLLESVRRALCGHGSIFVSDSNRSLSTGSCPLP